MSESESPFQLSCAKLEWEQDSIPIARDFGDIYFQKQLGLEETDYVFLRGNSLACRWKNRWKNTDSEAVGEHFTIAETGFGTGLNFLAAWQLWDETAPKHCQLHYISTEKHPLRAEDLQRSLQTWPQLSNYSEQLIENYPLLIPGHHVVKFDNDRVHLHLLFGDAIESFEQLLCSDHPDFLSSARYRVDAWFLDGFAPAKNPSLWNDSLYRLMAQLSSVGSTVATFTAVSAVRRGLIAQGFTMENIPGFKKRNMLRGVFKEEIKDTEKHYNKGVKAPWYIPGKSLDHTGQKHVAIIGGGLAGCSSAYSLARRGWKVTLLERASKLASGASGNAQGMLYTKLSPQPGHLNNFTLSSYLYAFRFYKNLLKQDVLDSKYADFCGMLQLVDSAKEQRRYEELERLLSRQPELVKFLDPAQASKIAGVKVAHPAYFFPNSGWISPPKVCAAVASHPNIQILNNSDVSSLQYDKTWRLFEKKAAGESERQLLEADIVIIANGSGASAIEQSKSLPVKVIRGQITSLHSRGALESLQTVICHEGYITPAIDGVHSLGATFDLGDYNTDVRSEDHRRNLDSLYKSIPSLLNSPADEPAEGRAGLRCVTPDYMPMVGPLHKHSAFLENYALLRKDSHQKIDNAGEYYPGLYINVGHGSRGLTSTPLCAELLAAQISADPPPMPRNLVKALNPARFIIRDLIRNKTQHQK